MIHFKSIFVFFRDWCQFICCFARIAFMSDLAKDIEIIALRSQLSLYQQQSINHKLPKPRPTPAFRQLWVFISKLWPDWKSALMIVKPETVISWHHKAFRLYWLWKSRHRGRPKISQTTIALIQRIHKENPLWSPERIHDQLLNLGITDVPAPNTIAKYLPSIKKPPSKKSLQSWKTFLTNHQQGIWAKDFLTVPTLCFKVLYVLMIVSHDRRVIKHFAITSHPTSAWVAQQLRETTSFGMQPEYLIHDNDSIFVSNDLQAFLANTKIRSVRTGFHSPWQNGICERTVGILRRELLDHIIPMNEKHLEYLLKKYIDHYYNPHRTHQGIGRQTPLSSVKRTKTLINKTSLISEPILGGLYHNYHKVA
ncbi:MAG TPA: integrase [Firmicutes bacterium]|nr:integrase [Bacillota bacterium]